MFKESSSMEEKLKVFFDICDIKQIGSISFSQFYDLLNKNMIFPEQKIELKGIGKINIHKLNYIIYTNILNLHSEKNL